MKIRKIVTATALILALLGLAGCGSKKVETQVENKVETVEESCISTTDGISVSGALPKDAKLSVSVPDRKELLSIVEGAGYSLCAPYSIEIINSNQEVIQPEGRVSVELPWPDGYEFDPHNNNYFVAYIDIDNSSLELIPATITPQTISFETNHFSIYSLVFQHFESVERNNYTPDSMNPVDPYGGFEETKPSPFEGRDDYFWISDTSWMAHISGNHISWEKDDYYDYATQESDITYDSSMGVWTTTFDGQEYVIDAYNYEAGIKNGIVTLIMYAPDGSMLNGNMMAKELYEDRTSATREYAKMLAEEQARIEEEARIRAAEEARAAFDSAMDIISKAQKEALIAKAEANMTPEEKRAAKYGSPYKKVTATAAGDWVGNIGTVEIELYGNHDSGTAIMQINGQEVIQNYYCHEGYAGGPDFNYTVDNYAHVNGYILEIHYTGDNTAEIFASEGQESH